MGITSRLAEFVRRTSFEDLPAEVVSRSKDMMLNAAAVALAGAAQPESQAINGLIQEMRGNGKCTIIGMGLRTSPVYAALANGVMVRLLDFDDEIMRRGSHPSSVIFPVVMSLGEMNGYSGKDVLTAFALGCEVFTKLAVFGSLDDVETIGEAPLARRGWDLDGVAGTIGATAAAAKLLELDQEQLENAFGLAAGEAAGVRANLATPGQAFQCGRAAMNGIMAAMLAHKGFAASRDAVEAPEGLLACIQGNTVVNEDPFFARMGYPYDIVYPGVALKVYPCELAAHPSLDAMLQLVQQYRTTPGQVAAIGVSVTPAVAGLLPYSNPQTGRQAKLSLNYLMAVSLLYGQPLLAHFADDSVGDPRLRELMARVTVAATEAATALIARPSTVTLTLADGRALRHRVEFARGHPELPLTTEELDAKFLYCSRYILPPDHIEGAIDQFRNLENVQDITALASILGG